MNTVHRPVTFEIDDPENAQWIIHNANEIASFLLRLLDNQTNLTLYLDDGQEIISSTLFDVDIERGEFCVDLPAMADSKKISSAKRVTIAATPERVKLQFRSTHHRLGNYEGRAALFMALPRQMLRLQRREFFRLDTPVSPPVTCRISMPTHAGGQEVLNFVVSDISGGGVGLRGNPEQTQHFEPGKIFQHCRLDIPGEGGILVTLEVKKMVEIGRSTDSRSLKIGCEFQGLAPVRLNQIERYIARTERERKARLSGLA